jgi:hypothetical protein
MTVDQEERQPLTPQQAIAQIGYLRDLVEETRIRIADGYREFAMWGCVWVLGYGATAVYWSSHDDTGARAGWMWLGLIGLATLGHILLFRGYRRTGRRSERGTTLGRRLLLVNLVVAFAALMHPFLYESVTLRSSGAYMAFWIGVAYVINGIFVGRELAAIGGWFFIVSYVARLIDQAPARSLWLAVAGGGSLLLTSALLYRESRQHRQAA